MPPSTPATPAISANNLGFAIPANTARDVVGAILDHGKVNRSYVGIELQPLQDFNTFYDIAIDRGVLIRSVDQDSPAAIAGIKAEDILLAINNQPVVARFPEQLASIRRLIADTPIGSSIALTIQRSAGKKVEQHTLSMATEKLESVITEEAVIAELGISVRDVTRTYLRTNRLPKVNGVIVTSIRDGSPAQDANFAVGDIITRVANHPILDADDLTRQMEKIAKTGKTLIDVQRDRNVITLAVKLNS
jgi:serine protease Do